MARAHTNIPTDLGIDAEFVALPESAQWSYYMLSTQAGVSSVGVQTLALNRWGSYARDLNPILVLDGIRTLALSRFAVLDESTDEVLITDYMANNGIDRQPNQVKKAYSDADLIHSPLIRDAVAQLFERIDRPDAELAALNLREGRGNRPSQRPNRRSIPRQTRQSAYLRDGFACVYCGLQFPITEDKAPELLSHNQWLELDHVKPYSLGGDDSLGNLRSACSSCNRSRGVDDMDLWADRIVVR